MSFFSLLFLPIALGIAALVLLFLCFYVLLPLKNLQYYKKQGIKTTYFPVLGVTKFRLGDLREKNDFLYEVKNSSKVDPDQKAVATNMGSDVMLLLRDAEYMKDFLQNPSNFEKAKLFNIYRMLLGRGLLFTEGAEWKSHRKIISSCFHFNFLKNNVQLIQETTREILDNIPAEKYKNLLIMDKIQEITGEVVGRMFFGRNLSRYTLEGESLTTALGNLMASLGGVIATPLYMLFNTKMFWFPIPKIQKLKKRIETFRGVCYKIIQDRKQENQRYNDLLDALLTHQSQASSTNDEEGKLSDEDIIDEFVTFFVAGMDTTGHLITMMLYNLTQHPEYLLKLKKEREETYDKMSQIDAETVQNMDVLTCFLKETLRHYTPAIGVFLRETKEDCMLKDIHIKKGTIVRIDLLAAYFHNKHFDEPEKFNPDRWQEGQSKLNPYAFIPFSAGPRNCIGQHLALLEAKIIMSEFLKRFECKLSDGYQLKMVLRFLYEPYEDMKLDLTRIASK